MDSGDDHSDDEAPAFLDEDDVEEVIVDDTDIPMDDDDDDDEDEDDDNETKGNEAEQVQLVDDKSKAQITSHTDHVYAVAIHLDSITQVLSILSGAGDDSAFLHKLIPGGMAPQSILLPHKHSDSVSCVAFNLSYRDDNSPKLAAVGGYDGGIIIYDPDTGTKITQLEGPSDVEWLAWHPKGGTVLLVGSIADGTIWMYHVPQKTCMQVFCGHEAGVTAGAFSPDGKWALSASQDGSLRVWAPRTGLCKHSFKTGNAGLTCMAIGGGVDGQLILAGAEDGLAHLCHLGTKKVITSLKHFEVPIENTQDEMELPMSVEAVAFSLSHPNWCATGGVDGVLKIWDLANDGHCRQQCPIADAGGITRIIWHPTVPLVFSSYSDGSIQLWDTRNGQLLTRLTGHTDMINDLAVQFLDNNHAIVVTGSDDHTVRIFEVDIAAILQTPGLQ